MFQRTGNDEIHPGECLICTLTAFFVSCLKGQLRQQMIDDRIILSIRKECRPRLRQNFPDSINLDQLFHGNKEEKPENAEKPNDPDDIYATLDWETNPPINGFYETMMSLTAERRKALRLGGFNGWSNFDLRFRRGRHRLRLAFLFRCLFLFYRFLYGHTPKVEQGKLHG